MLKEYRFNVRDEYYPFKLEKEITKYYVNSHKVDADSYYTLFDKARSSMPLDNTYVFFWKNNKTGSYTRDIYWTFNEETYDV